MGKIETARRYFEAVLAVDPKGVSELFTEDGVIDDYVGGHHVGRAGIEAFIGIIPPGRLHFSEPERWLEEGERLNVYGRVQRPDEPEEDNVRWIFHFRGERISHLGNSKVDALFLEPK